MYLFSWVILLTLVCYVAVIIIIVAILVIVVGTAAKDDLVQNIRENFVYKILVPHAGRMPVLQAPSPRCSLHSCAGNAQGMRRVYTRHAPGMRREHARHVPGMRRACAENAPEICT